MILAFWRRWRFAQSQRLLGPDAEPSKAHRNHRCVVALAFNRLGEEACAACAGTTAWQRSQEHDQHCRLLNYREGRCSFKAYREMHSVYEEMRADAIACNTISDNPISDACAKCNATVGAARLLRT